MAVSKRSPEEEAFLKEIDSLVDEGISAMSPAEFRKFVKKSDKTMAEIKRHASDRAESSETPPQEQRAAQA